MAKDMRPIDLLKHPYRALRKLGDKWMAYRYGVMPLVYSYRDALKAASRGELCKDTTCCVVNPRNLCDPNPSPSTYHSKVVVEGNITFRGTILQKFSSQSMSSFASLGVNPLVTAWELIPYSFVIDWFVNVGDYINAHTSANYADEYQACISRRDSYTTKKYFHFTAGSDVRTVAVAYNTPCPLPVPVAVSLPNHIRPEEYQLISCETIDNYSRQVIDIRNVPLVWNPSLNWKRLVDGAVLANNQLKKLAPVVGSFLSGRLRR